MAAPNIVNVTSIVGKSTGLAASTTAQTLLSNPVSSNAVYKVNSLMVSNINGVGSASITVSLFKGVNEFKLAHTIFVPAQASLVIVSKDTSIYLEENDNIKVTASLNSYLHVVCSYELIT